jgi:hypothetical protein
VDVAGIEKRLGLTFSEWHRRAMLDRLDPIHDACDFLVPDAPYELLDIVQVNDFLHCNSVRPWPTFLVAYASNGCGDYYAYDLRSRPPRIVYIDPIDPIEESLLAGDQLEFDSFDSWYPWKLDQHRQVCGYKF